MIKKSGSTKKEEGMANGPKRVLTALNIAVPTIIFAVFGILSWIIPIKPTVSELENRALAKFPRFSAESFCSGEYFADIDLYYADTFPFRERFVRLNEVITKMKGLYIGKNVYIHWRDDITSGEDVPDEFENLASPQTTAIPEATDRPMMGETPKPDGMPEATAAPEPTDTPEPAPTAEPTSTPEPEPTIEPDGTHVEVDLNGGESYSTSSIVVIDDVAMEYYGFAQQSASRYVAALNDIAAAFDETVNVYNMIVPTAIEFYLPEKYGGNTGYQRKAINYYYSGLSERIRTIDVYDDLKSHMAEYIYFRTDHHWTQRGAYYAYRVFMEAIGETPHELSEYRTKSVPGYLGSLYKYLGGYAALEKNPDVVEIFYPITAYTAEKYDSYGGGRSEAWLVYEEISHSHTYSYFMGGDNPLTVAVTEAGNDRKLLVIKESYGNAITPLFADHFSEVHAIDPRSYYARTIPQYVTENGITDVLFINYTVGAGAVNVIDGLERLK